VQKRCGINALIISLHYARTAQIWYNRLMNSSKGNSQIFFKALHTPTGKYVYTLLSADQLVIGGVDDQIVAAYEERACEMIPVDVALSDLREFEVQ